METASPHGICEWIHRLHTEYIYIDKRNLLVHHHQTASRDQRVAPIQMPHMVGEKERGMRNEGERELVTHRHTVAR